jgi:hypothetical protein
MKLVPLLLALSCTPRDAAPDAGLESMATPITCNDTVCADVIAHKGQTVTTAKLSCCYALLAAACHYNPSPVPPTPDSSTGGLAATGGTSGNPVPPAAGGSLGTGGRASTGGASTGGATTGPSTPEQLACANVAKFCAPKTATSCLADVAKIESTPKYASINLQCLIVATSQTAIQSCKSVACGSVK